MVILYFKIHSVRIIDVPGCNDMWPTSQKYAQKRDILSEKRDGAKKREFTPENGNVDTYELWQCAHNCCQTR